MLRKNNSLPESSPLPSLSAPDLESIEKFLSAAGEHCAEVGRDEMMYLDWAIHVLLTSMMADNASRIFLPKTETAPFDAEDLFPFSAVEPSGRQLVELSRSFVISPVWNNVEAITVMEYVRSGDPSSHELNGAAVGWYIKELNLAVINKDVHLSYFSRFYGRGQALLYAYRLKDLAEQVSTDMENWYVTETNGEETWCPVLEPRMALLYKLALRRYFGEPLRED